MRSADFGVDFYGDILFTSQLEVDRQGQRTGAAFCEPRSRGLDLR
jgi:hypothetical protein